MIDTEYVEREAEDTQPPPEMTDEHLVMPPEIFNKQALETYLALRDANPWLPETNRVTAADSLILNFGVNQMPTLNLTVYVNLPVVITNDGPQA